MMLLVIGSMGVALSRCGVINDMGVIESYQSRMIPSLDSDILLSFFIYYWQMLWEMQIKVLITYVKCNGMYRKFGIYIMIG